MRRLSMPRRRTRRHEAHFGDGVYLRGLIEVEHRVAANDAAYCGLGAQRRAERYRLTRRKFLRLAPRATAPG